MPDKETDEFVLALARRLREVVLPYLGAHVGRRSSGPGAGGDPTFAVDEIAEQALEQFVAAHAPRLAFYSEDRGLVLPADSDPVGVLIVDPIDGTRPAMAGFEAACVAVALAPVGSDGLESFGLGSVALSESGSDGPRMADLTVGCIVEIKTGDWFLARRGAGVRASQNIRVSSDVSLSSMFWAYGFRGRPARETTEVLAELIDTSSVGGGTFELGSQAFAMTRVVTGQLDAVIEVGSRLIEDVPGMRSAFERVGHGHVLNNSPYDLAAPWLILTEAGGVVTDGWGRPLDDYRLLGSGHEFQISSISAATPELHAELLDAVNDGIERVRAHHARA